MPIVRELGLINKLQFAATYVLNILISKSDTTDNICDRAHQSLLLEIFLFHNTKELNYFKCDEKLGNKYAAWPYAQARGSNHEEYYSCCRFQEEAEITSKSSGFVLSLTELNLIKNLYFSILAEICSQIYQYFLILWLLLIKSIFFILGLTIFWKSSKLGSLINISFHISGKEQEYIFLLFFHIWYREVWLLQI